MPFRLPAALSTEDDSKALSYLRTYYGKGGNGQYTGAYFDDWALDQDAFHFSADDVVAVSFLSVFVPPMAAHRLLVTEADRFSELLRGMGPDRDLATEEAPIDDTWTGRRLYRALLALPNVGPTTASKLAARKRPRLVPIYDSVVAQVTDGRVSYWEPLRLELRRPDGGLHARLLRLKADAGLPDGISAIRVFDVVTWMEGKDRNLAVDTPEERLASELATGA
jgi:hypothetical protein